MSETDAAFFRKNYKFLRSVESGLRLMNTTARHDMPNDPVQLERLAFLLNVPSAADLALSVGDVRYEVRSKSESLFGIEARPE